MRFVEDLCYFMAIIFNNIFFVHNILVSVNQDTFRCYRPVDNQCSPYSSKIIMLNIFSFVFQKQVAVEVGFTNPTDEEITLQVEIQPCNVGLSGCSEFKVKPKERGIYQLLYGPAVIGKAKGR